MGKLSALQTWRYKVPNVLTSFSILSCLFYCGGNVVSSYVTTFQVTYKQTYRSDECNESHIVSVLCLCYAVNKRRVVLFNFLVLNWRKTVSGLCLYLFKGIDVLWTLSLWYSFLLPIRAFIYHVLVSLILDLLFWYLLKNSMGWSVDTL